MQCVCHCIKCGSIELLSNRTGEIEKDGYYNMHHTCLKCRTHFDHLEGEIFDSCEKCRFSV